MDNIFYHKGCGGVMSIDILKSFTWKSPSITLTPDGLKIGVTEFRGTSGKKNGVAFSCNKCDKEISIADAGSELELECTVCQKKFSIEHVSNNRQLQCVCDDCQQVLTGKKEPTTARQKDFVKYIFLGAKQKDISFVPVTTILDKSVSF